MTEIDSLIGEQMRVVGHLMFRGGLRIDGVVIGNVVAEAGQESLLLIAGRGRVEGEVCCDHLILNGEIKGCVMCAHLLEMQPHACIIGDVWYRVLEMHAGARVIGKMHPLEKAGRVAAIMRPRA